MTACLEGWKLIVLLYYQGIFNWKWNPSMEPLHQISLHTFTMITIIYFSFFTRQEYGTQIIEISKMLGIDCQEAPYSSNSTH